MSLICKKLSILFYLLVISFCALSQINGSTTPSAGVNIDYTFDSGSLYIGYNWVITNGTIVSSTPSGTLYSATVQWTAGGAGTLSFRNKLSVISTLNVTVCGALAPTGTFSYIPNCNTGHLTNFTTVTISGAPAAGQTWYWQENDPNGTSTTNSGASYSTIPGVTLYLRGYENATGCWSTSSLAAATIPNRPTITLGSSCGSGTVQLNASLGANGTEVRWYDGCPGGSLVGTGTIFTTSTLSVTTTYYASSYNSSTGAESPKVPVVATIYPMPNAAGGSASPSVFCGSGTTTLTGTGAGTNEEYRWYNVSTAGSTISTTQTVSATTPFYVSRYNAVTGCEGSRTAITVTVNPLPGLTGGSASPSVLCGSGATTLTGTGAGANEEYRWYNVSSGGSTISTSQTVSSTTPFYASRYNTITGCEGSRTVITVTVNPLPGTAGGSASPSVFCGPGTTTLTGTGAGANETYRWYNVTSGGSTISTSQTVSSTTPFYVSRYNTVTGCEGSRTTVNVTVNPLPGTAEGSASPSVFCGPGTTTLTGTGAGANEAYRWYNVSSGGSTISTSQTVSSTTPFYVSRYNTVTGCEGSRTTVTVTVNPLPGTAGGSASPSAFCGPGTTTLTGTGAGANEAYRWYNVSSGGSTISTSQTVSSTTPFYVSRYNTVTGCEGSRTTVTVTVNPLPGTAGGSVSPNALCGSGTVVWSGSGAVTNETYKWYSVPTGGTSITPATSISATTMLYVSRYNTVTTCEGSRTSVTVTVNPPVTTAPTITGNSRFGSGNLTIAGNGTPPGGDYKWYNASNVYQSSGPSYTAISVGTSVTNYMFVKSVSSAGCESPSTAINIYVYPLPTISAPQNFVVKETSVTMDAGAGFDSYSWKNSSNAVVAITQTFSTNVPNTYTVTVTKMGATGVSIPFVLSGSQFSGMNMNYIVTNVSQIGGITDVNVMQSLSSEKVAQSIAYFDGLGRPIQSVATQSSPAKIDLVTPVVYDEFGREKRKYLPVVVESNGRFKSNLLNASGNYQVNTYNNASDKIADDLSPFSETIFEPSPLNRVIEQGSPGVAWQPDGVDSYTSPDRTIKKSYETNGVSEVLLWTFTYPIEEYTTTAINAFGKINAGTPTAPVYYGANQLNKSKTKDEEYNEVIEYTDKEGRTVLKRVQAIAGAPAINDANYASTYYIYDDFGSLVCVVPPEAVKRITQTSPASEYFGMTDTQKNDFLKRWAFRYRYDMRRRMTMKQVPGAEPVYMVYDNRDRLILTQDGNQRAGATSAIKYWTFTKYDEINRPIMTGIKDTTTTVQLTQAQMQTAVNNHFAKASARWGETYVGNIAGNVHGYTNRSYPVRTGGASDINPNKYLSVTYYDSYLFRSLWYGTYTYLNESIGESANGISYIQPITENLRVVGQVTGNKIKVLDGGVSGGYTWLKSVSYYDDQYRVVQTLSENYKGGVDRVTHVIDFVGKILKSKSTHTESDITWRDKIVANQFGNKLTRTDAGGTWSAGAASVQQLTAGQSGWIEVVASETNTYRMIGLADTNPDGNYTSIDFAWYFLNNGTLQIYESGALKGSFGAFASGDVFKIERTGTTIKYYQNNVLKYTSLTSSSSILMADVSIYSGGATISGVRSSFSTTTKNITRRFEYDHAGRLLKIWHMVDAQPEILLAFNEYNELGQLVDKKLHSTIATGTNAKQSVDYRYNIRGWLTSMNDASLTNTGTNNDDSGDLFGMNLAYNKTDLGLSNTGLFNGNISGITWSNNLALGTVKQNGYIYTYDPLNRIKTSSYKEKASSWTTLANNALSETGFSYDHNGNITSLQRNDRRTTGLMDDMVYSYGTGSNKLLRVTDNGDDKVGFIDGNPAATDDYTYDANGNMTRDLNKGIGGALTDNANLFTYNFLNLPETVTKGGNSVRYVYDAAGLKLTQTTTFGGQQKQTDYSGEFQYENDVLQFISHEEGRIAVAGNKSIIVHDGSTVTNITAATSTLATVTQNGTQTYVRATSVGTTAKQGMFPIGGTMNVIAGERYRIRAKGYRTGANAVYLLIKTNAIDLSWPGAQLPNSAATEAWVEQEITIPVGHTTLQAGVVWNTVTAGQTFFLNDFEITKLTSTTAEYQYHLKDHLGNVRLTFTSKDEIETGTATMETASANTEQSQFLNYTEAIKVNTAIFDHTNTGGTFYSTRLTGGTTNAITGLAKSLSVMPGDKIDIEVFAKYLDPNSANWTAAMTSFMAAIAGGTAPAGTVIDGGLAGSLGSNIFPFPNVLVRNNDNSTGPKGYLNYLVFDRNYVYKTGGFKRLSTSARETGNDIPHERLAFDGVDQILIKEPGYVYIWLSNENAATVEVYFDDFKVTHTKSPVIQQDDYYPFGLTFNSNTRENNIANDYNYNGMELQDELSLELYDYHARQYDPATGRFITMDPHSENYFSWSTFTYVANNPIILTDPTGKDWYQDEKGNTMWKKGNDEIEGYKNIGASFSYRQGDLTLTYNQNDISTIEEHVLEPNEWVTDQRKDANGDKVQCFKAAKEMSDKTGSETLGGGVISSIVTGQEENGTNSHSIKSTGRKTEASDYVNSQIDNGNSVVVGVDYKQGSPNNDNATDHFVAISSRITNVQTGTQTYGFYDPGTSFKAKGTHSSNILSFNKAGLLSGKTYYSGTTYTVTQIRKNK